MLEMDEFHATEPQSAYLIIFPLDKVDEEDLLNVENRILSSGYAYFDRDSDYSKGVRTWLLDWKNQGETPHEIIHKLKRYHYDLYKLIRVKKIE
jgi:hypothetical protein